MTAKSIERLFTRLMWAICLGVIVRWLVIHKLDYTTLTVLGNEQRL